jgi:predicted DNA-binding protein
MTQQILESLTEKEKKTVSSIINEAIESKIKDSNDPFFRLNMRILLDKINKNDNNGTKKMNEFKIVVEKKKPKKNAKSYNIVTISDFFEVATNDNVNRILKDFAAMMQHAVLLRELTNSIAKAEGSDKKDHQIILKSFDWIDD